MNPYIIINYKTYEQSTGKNAQKLSLAYQKVAKGNKRVMLAVQPTDLCCVASLVKLPVLSQHVDYMEPGRNTGFILPETIKADGAVGTLLNHAEHRITYQVLKKTIEHCKRLKLKTVVCIPDTKNLSKIIKLKPTFIAYEEPSLISTGKSISQLMPKQVKKFAERLKGTGIIPLTGAGISTAEDVKKALELGTKGVLVASALIKTKDPGKVLKSFLDVQ